MIANKRVALAALIIVLFMVTACTPTAGEPGIAQAPQIGAIVPFGSPEVRDLAPTSEVVPNCDGVTSPVIKHPSMTVGSSHSVEWQVGGSIGTGVTIGGGVVPGGVDLQAALEGHVANDLTNSIQQSNAWDLPADPGTIMEYTIMWREVWQPGYLDMTFMKPEPEMLRIDVKYRTGVQSDIVGSKVTLCDPGASAQVETNATQPLSASTNVPPTQPPTDPPMPSPVTLSVWATNESGEIFRAGRKGTYRVTYVGDAYTPWPSTEAEGYRGWTTILRYYVNRPVEWGTTDFGLQGPINEDGYLTPGNYYLDKNDAIASAGNDSRQVNLNAGEHITFIVLDEKERYFDNQGKVDVQIVYLGE
jgi:hypothetical protein